MRRNRKKGWKGGRTQKRSKKKSWQRKTKEKEK
jgi:hypothetical protein